MSFLPLPSDNPFVPGDNMTTRRLETEFNLDGLLTIVRSTNRMNAGPWYGLGYNAALGVSYEVDANRNLQLSGSPSESSRPVSGLVYPRLT